MNQCTLSGRVSQVYFDTIRGKTGNQPFLAFLLVVDGPRAEGPSVARIVMYGAQAQTVFGLLTEGLFVEVESRFRVRREPERDRVYEFVARRIEIPRFNANVANSAIVEGAV